MANRQSEAAPAPPPAAPAPAPAARQKIPDFAGAETDNQQTVALQWNDYDANDGGGMPGGDGSGIDMGGTDRPEAGRPTKGRKTTVNVAGTSAEADPDSHLDAHGAEGDVAVGTRGQPGDEETEVPAPRANASERRRLALEALGREQQTRAMETELIAERAKREDFEKKFKSATLGELIAMRGGNREEWLERLIAGKEDEGSEVALTPEQRQLKAQDEKIAALEKRDADRETETQRLKWEGVMGSVANHALGNADVPVVHAAVKSNAVVDHDDKTGRPLRAAEWIYGLGMAEWKAAGSKDGEQMKYLKAATEVLEDHLIAQSGPVVDAVIAKRGGARQEAAPASAPRPPSLRRPAARPEARPAPLPRDRDALDVELKKRFNLR